MISFIQLFEQWIKDGDKDIYMLPTVMKAKDPRSAEVLELINWYCDQYQQDKTKLFVADRDMNKVTLGLIGASYSNLNPLINKVIRKLIVGNFAGSEKDHDTTNQFVYVFIKENFFRNVETVYDAGVKHSGRHLYVKFQFMYEGNPYKSLTLGKKQKAKIDPSEIILKDISVHPTDKLTI